MESSNELIDICIIFEAKQNGLYTLQIIFLSSKLIFLNQGGLSSVQSVFYYFKYLTKISELRIVNF